MQPTLIATRYRETQALFSVWLDCASPLRHRSLPCLRWLSPGQRGRDEAVRRPQGGDAVFLRGVYGVQRRDFDRLLLQEHGSIVIGTGTTLTCLTAIKRQEDGEWRLVHAHFCVDVPDEEAATYRRGAWV